MRRSKLTPDQQRRVIALREASDLLNPTGRPEAEEEVRRRVIEVADYILDGRPAQLGGHPAVRPPLPPGAMMPTKPGIRGFPDA
jgi:hypothetical protein